MIREIRQSALRASRQHDQGFSLIELVIVVVIIAIIGAIAIPKMSRGAAGAADAKLVGDLATLRSAIDLFQAEHGGVMPTLDMIVADLTLFSDSSGTSAATTPDALHLYGPYLRAVPALGVGQRKGNAGIGAVDGQSIGWIYEPGSGNVRANTTTETDATGKLYSSY
jgi:general secretion pathway protein G